MGTIVCDSFMMLKFLVEMMANTNDDGSDDDDGGGDNDDNDDTGTNVYGIG